MTKEEMVQATQILFDTFDVHNKEGKLRTLYEFFKLEQLDNIRLAARYIARDNDRFPKMSVFSETLKTIKRGQIPKVTNVTDCKWCQGYGTLSAVDEDDLYWSYRCQCLNAAKFERYPKWFGELHPGKRLDFYHDISANQEIYRKGLAKLKEYGINIPAGVVEKIEKFIGGKKQEECPF